MKKLLALILISLLPAVIFARLSQSGQAKPLVFTHVTVIDATGAPPRPDITLVIVGDRITELGPTKKVRVPKDAHVVEATGKFLIPGLWDMHVHTFRHNPRSTNTWFFPLFIANGITGVRDMWTTGDDFPQVVQLIRGRLTPSW
jgi:predicted amidohydrolase